MYMKGEGSRVVFLVLYVDDILPIEWECCQRLKFGWPRHLI